MPTFQVKFISFKRPHQSVALALEVANEALRDGHAKDELGPHDDQLGRDALEESAGALVAQQVADNRGLAAGEHALLCPELGQGQELGESKGHP